MTFLAVGGGRSLLDRAPGQALGCRSRCAAMASGGTVRLDHGPQHPRARDRGPGIVHAGGTAISVYNTLAPEQVEYVANHSEATVAFVEDEAFLQKFLSIRAATPHLQHLVLIRGSAPAGVMTWDELVAKGKELVAKSPADFDASWKAVGPKTWSA